MVRILIDGREDFKALDSDDVPASPLPYDDITLSDTTTFTDVDSDVTQTNELFSDTDWGADLDFYVNQIAFIATSLNNYFNAAEEGIFLSVYFQDVSLNQEYIYRGAWEFTYSRPILNTTDNLYYFARTIDIPQLRKCDAASTIYVEITNRSAADNVAYEIYISGIPK